MPSYSTSVKDLFTAVAKHIIRASGELRILCSVESPKYIKEHINGEAFPSWVPDWRASSESIQNVLHDRNLRSEYRATRESVLDYDPSPNANRLHLFGILIGAVDQAGIYNDFHSISDFNLGNRYDHTNQPITTALRQAQTLDFDYIYERIGVEHPNRRILASFFDLPMETRFHSRKCKQCPIAYTMPILPMEQAKQNPKLAHVVRDCRKNMRSRASFNNCFSVFRFWPTLYCSRGSNISSYWLRRSIHPSTDR